MNERLSLIRICTKQQAEALLLPVGIILRIICFISNLFIVGIHSDEAIMSLNAFSIADTLTDINGEKFPIYFDTWVIGGQSPIAIYLSALSVKIFGHNLFAIRFPMLIFSIIGFAVFIRIIGMIFESDKFRITAKLLACISPWMLFSSAYVLDCNYLPHFIIIGSLFLLKAIDANKTAYYVLSMLFFGLGFYCYIASVLIIPFILSATYLVLLIKKRISIKDTLISVITITAVSSLFIIFGMVQKDILPEMNILGISITKMPDYSRVGSVLFSSRDNVFVQAVINLFLSLVLIGGVDYNATGIGNGIFQFGNLLGGLFVIIGAIVIIRNRKAKCSFLLKIFILICAVGTFSFCLLINNSAIAASYRYGMLSYFLIIIEAIGFATIVSNIKKFSYKKVLSLYLALSLTLFVFEFGVLYANQTDTVYIYGDSLLKCVDVLEQNGQKDIAVCTSNTFYNKHCSVFLRYHFYGDGEKDFVKLYDELYDRSVKESVNTATTNDNSVVIISGCKKESDLPDKEYFIIEDSLTGLADSGKYELTDYGYCKVAHRVQN